MTYQRIQALPLHLANQIAAGEVVERPASVLKELVENSIDAGATHIRIEIAAAGKELISVSDNGSGIHQQDLALALSRHATSKLHSSEDLSQISSLGFRGEALPSIASVSQLTLTSRLLGEEHAWQISSSDDTAVPAAHPQGTTVSVAELFFNLPARRRFLRSDKTELHHMISTLQRLALSRFDVGIDCHWGNQQQLKLPAITDKQNYVQRLYKICGKQFVEHSRHLQQTYDGIILEGWIAGPEAHRAQTDIQYFFINGRVIRDRVINHAIRQAYGEYLPDGRQPAFVLYLTLPLDRVDVNVHPTKHEVRFRDARLIHGLITQGIREALAQSPQQTSVEIEQALPFAEPAIAEKRNDYIPQPLAKTSTPLSHKSVKQAASSHFQLLLQRYAVLNDPEPVLLDLQQADLSLRQQQLTKAMKEKTLASRPILVPLRFPLEAPPCLLLMQHQKMLEDYAFKYRINDNIVTVERIPYLLAQVDIQSLLKQLLTALPDNEQAEDALQQALLAALSIQPITSEKQAETILNNLPSDIADRPDLYVKLDSITLGSLFSA